MVSLRDAQTFCATDSKTVRHVKEIYLPRVQSEIKQLERMVEHFPVVADEINIILEEQKAVLRCINQRLGCPPAPPEGM
jgi:hypothetical protein